jgi:hypothetical protein
MNTQYELYITLYKLNSECNKLLKKIKNKYPRRRTFMCKCEKNNIRIGSLTNKGFVEDVHSSKTYTYRGGSGHIKTHIPNVNVVDNDDVLYFYLLLLKIYDAYKQEYIGKTLTLHYTKPYKNVGYYIKLYGIRCIEYTCVRSTFNIPLILYVLMQHISDDVIRYIIDEFVMSDNIHGGINYMDIDNNY